MNRVLNFFKVIHLSEDFIIALQEEVIIFTYLDVLEQGFTFLKSNTLSTGFLYYIARVNNHIIYFDILEQGFTF